MAWSAKIGFSAVATAAATLVLAGTASAAGTPGGQSLHDPYFPNDGNTGYKADHYGLRVTYQPGADKLSGTATIRATTTQDLSRFSFDFFLHTDSVRVNGRPAKFTSKNGKLIITPAKTLRSRHHFTVTVNYHGVPGKVRIGGQKVWTATKTGLHTVAEPHLSSAWFPLNDHPLNKAYYDVAVSVPNGTQAIATGVLTGTHRDHGRTWWYWHGGQPQASYNQVLSIGQFTFKTRWADGRPFYSAYEKSITAAQLKEAKADIERTPEILKWESSVFGRYPFSGSGGVVVNDGDANDAEEYQGLPVYQSGNFDKNNPPHTNNVYVVVHENAHQWFGDQVTVTGWNNIWLNEGFANYTEWLWSEHTHQGTAQQLADQYYKQYKPTDKYWQIEPGNPGAATFLADPVYTRGAMTLQALRNVVGDRAFFTILREWQVQHRYGNADIQQFIALSDKVSGKSLDYLFHVWLFTKGRPAATPENGFPKGHPAAGPAPASFAAINSTRHR